MGEIYFQAIDGGLKCVTIDELNRRLYVACFYVTQK